MSAGINLSRVDSQVFRCAGGLNIVDPPITLNPGAAILAQNYECRIGGGYSRMKGYERYNGKALTSSYTYIVAHFFSGGVTPIVQGNTVTGATSGAIGIVLTNPVLTSGSWAGGDGAGDLYISVSSGTFVNNENLLVAAVNLATINPAAGTDLQSPGDTYYKTALRYLRESVKRTLITALPGYGAPLGLSIYNGKLYAWQNDLVAPTKAQMYRAEAGGWTLIAFDEEISFSNANTSVGEGDTLTQGGVTSTIKRLIVQTGTLLSGVNTGRMVIRARGGGNYGAGAATSTGGGVLTLSGIQTVIALAPSGTFETVIYNFAGGTGTRRMYGCDGKNRAFEFDDTGDVFSPISTGMTTDTPQHIAAHKNYLWLSFLHSVQNSGVTSPFVWTPITGANEIAMGDNVTNLYSHRGDTLVIAGRDSLSIMYGSGPSTWNLKKLTFGTGAVPRCMAELQGSVMFVDDHALFQLAQVQEFGDYDSDALSKNVDPFFNASTRKALFVCVSHVKSMIRIFFDDKTVLAMTFYQGKPTGWTTYYLPHQFTCQATGDSTNNKELIYVGGLDPTDATKGHAYLLDSSTSHDGTAIESMLRLPFNYFKSPTKKKRFRKITLEMDTPLQFLLNITTDFDYGADQETSTYAVFASNSGGYWDISTWEQFFWDGAVVSAPFAQIDGVGNNIGFFFYHTDDIDEVFTIQAVILQYSIWGTTR